ncbi:hypothetical protein NKG94_21290 [Micromonospora sp. M12]
MLTGRDGLLVEARTALVRATGAVLVGPAGVGRTALARAVVADLPPRLFREVWITATEASGGCRSARSGNCSAAVTRPCTRLWCTTPC